MKLGRETGNLMAAANQIAGKNDSVPLYPLYYASFTRNACHSPRARPNSSYRTSASITARMDATNVGFSISGDSSIISMSRRALASSNLGRVAPAAKPGFAAVWVRGFDPDARRPPTVNVVSRPHVASLSPRTGFDAGGFLVSARGGDFVETALGAGDAGLECVFGSVGVEARFVSTALVLCEAPPAASTGAVTVEIADLAAAPTTTAEREL